MNILYTNANGILNKLDELKIFLSAHKNVELVFITESHLSKDILDAELQIEGYSLLRNDRNFQIKNENTLENISGGGGSLIYYKEYVNISVNECFDKAPDSLAISIQTSDGTVCLACIYRSPSLSNNQNDQLISCVADICNEGNDFETVIVGDLNLPDVSWETGAVNGLTDSNNKILIAQRKFMDLFNRSKECPSILPMK